MASDDLFIKVFPSTGNPKLDELINKYDPSNIKTPTIQGRKDDVGKLRYDLLPPDALEKLVEVYSIGAKKYGDDNYLQGMAWRRIIGAILRHIFVWVRGESYDKQDGQHHLASAAWGCMTLMVYELRKLGTDDRQKMPNM